MNHYDIKQVRLDGVPKISYKDGVGKHRGVCAHATANWGAGEQEDTAMSERNWEQNHWQDAFVHYFCDYNTILDVADDDYISYGCGKGNPYYINVELCQTKRADRFVESYNRWVYIMAKVLFDNKLGVIDGVTLVSHKWVSDHLGGTHQDPHEYLAYHGKLWADVVSDVTRVYGEFMSEGDEDMKPVVLDDWAWQELDKFVGDAYNDGTIESWDWVQKVRDKKINVVDWLTLKTFIDERRRIKA